MENEFESQEQKNAAEKTEEFKEASETTIGTAWDGYYEEPVSTQYAAQNFTII